MHLLEGGESFALCYPRDHHCHRGNESVRGVGGDGDGDGGVRGGESLCKGMCVVTPGTGMVVVTGLLPSSHVNRLWRRRWLVLWGEGLKVRPEERFKSGLGRSTKHCADLS